MDIEPIYFLAPGIDINVKFLGDGDKETFYKGKIQRINSMGNDANGTYVNCHIVYDDGEEVCDSYLYNKDFENKDSEDTWKYDSNMSLLIKYMVESNKEINSLKSRLPEEEEEEEEAYESSDAEEKKYDNNECRYSFFSFIESTSKIAFILTLSSYLSLWNYKMMIDNGWIA